MQREKKKPTQQQQQQIFPLSPVCLRLREGGGKLEQVLSPGAPKATASSQVHRRQHSVRTQTPSPPVPVGNYSHHSSPTCPLATSVSVRTDPRLGIKVVVWMGLGASLSATSLPRSDAKQMMLLLLCCGKLGLPGKCLGISPGAAGPVGHHQGT